MDKPSSLALSSNSSPKTDNFIDTTGIWGIFGLCGYCMWSWWIQETWTSAATSPNVSEQTFQSIIFLNLPCQSLEFKTYSIPFRTIFCFTTHGCPAFTWKLSMTIRLFWLLEANSNIQIEFAFLKYKTLFHVLYFRWYFYTIFDILKNARSPQISG